MYLSIINDYISQEYCDELPDKQSEVPVWCSEASLYTDVHDEPDHCRPAQVLQQRPFPRQHRPFGPVNKSPNHSIAVVDYYKSGFIASFVTIDLQSLNQQSDMFSAGQRVQVMLTTP